MVLIDTHAHIYSEKFIGDLQDVINRSKESNLNKIFMPNIDHTSIDDMLEVAEKYPEYCIPMMGLHPCSIKKDFEKELYTVEEWIKRRDFVAIGEIGLDFYWDKTFKEQQNEALKIQIEWAKEMDRPIVLHCRESLDETIQIVEHMKDKNLHGIFHCFTGTLAQAKKIISLGFHIGIGGVSTFKNSNLKEVIEGIPLDNMVLETDCPYLAPVPFRGKRNEPSYITYVAKQVAMFKQVSLDEVANTTTQNAIKIFDI